VRLGEVADVRTTPSPVAIRREAVSRFMDVEADVSGSLGAVADEIRARLANVSFPLEFHAEVLEEAAGEEIGATNVVAVALVAVVASFLLLQAAFRSWRLAAMAFLLLPVALVGGVLGALVDGAELSLGSAIGLVALLGLAVRISVLSIRRFQDLERSDGQGLTRAAEERLAPILTTATAVALLTFPPVVLGSRAGLEIVHPMAVVLLGGVLSVTLVSLFLLPALYSRLGAEAGPAGEWERAPGRQRTEREPAGVQFHEREHQG
jgi:Cu/Ag efflux pump CusA